MASVQDNKNQLEELKKMTIEHLLEFFRNNHEKASFVKLLNNFNEKDIGTFTDILTILSKISNLPYKQSAKLMMDIFLTDKFLFKWRKLIVECLKSDRTDSGLFQLVIQFIGGALNFIEKYEILDYFRSILDTLEDNEYIDYVVNELQYIKKCQEKISNILNKNDYKIFNIGKCFEDLCKDVTIRKNIVRGKYNDIEHYISIQFSLLREDFLFGLRQGIKEYREDVIAGNSRRKYTDVKVHQNCRVIGLDKHTGGYLLKFENSQYFKRLSSINNKRFLYGSLLLLSNDHFLKYIPVVVNDNSNLKYGILSVDLYESKRPLQIYDKFTVIEALIFFEPYNQILNVLHFQFEKFPMQKYILGNQIKSFTPTYVKKNFNYKIDDNVFNVFSDKEWPSAEELSLNKSQYDTLKAALINEFIVIQGPPGTGKTYLGLKIVEILLNNINLDCPILVISYTNHALDQFMSGILNYTHNVVRIGGQSKSDKLKSYTPFTLRQLSKKKWWNCDSIGHCTGTLIKLRQIIDHNQRIIELIDNHLGILPLEILKNLLNFVGLKNPDDYLTWLLTGIIRNEDLTNFDIKSEDGRFMEMNDKLKEMMDDDIIDEDLKILEDELKQSGVGNYCSINYKIDMSMIYKEMIKKEEFIKKLTHEDNENNDELIEEIELLNNCDKKILKQFIQMNHLRNKLINMKLTKMKSPWLMTSKERWAAYFQCEEKLRNDCIVEMMNVKDKFQKYFKILTQLRIEEDAFLIKNQNIEVIGLTTTGAARRNELLKLIQPKIVIIEEAAEVLESHIIASLPSTCCHLILIGDHKQLRPKPATYELARECNLNISLFERMVLNGMSLYSLDTQHRMRQNIANLVTPSIYPILKSHSSVFEYPNIKGVDKNLFFINHNILEDEMPATESHWNKFEAEFLIEFSEYLFRQSYDPLCITILTMYSEQLLYLKKLKTNKKLSKDLRICCVDDFQGEENDIILLSLVRSNVDANIGFLNVENRICVALSRAKHGFYIIGNMSNLSRRSSLWRKVRNTLSKQNAIGSKLPLKCELHNSVTLIEKPTDFEYLRRHNCQSICGILLKCGHKCSKTCHVQDPDHWAELKCDFICNRIICINNDNHPRCQLKCSDRCMKCMILKQITLNCGHTTEIFCHLDANPFILCSICQGNREDLRNLISETSILKEQISESINTIFSNTPTIVNPNNNILSSTSEANNVNYESDNKLHIMELEKNRKYTSESRDTLQKIDEIENFENKRDNEISKTREKHDEVVEIKPKDNKSSSYTELALNEEINLSEDVIKLNLKTKSEKSIITKSEKSIITKSEKSVITKSKIDDDKNKKLDDFVNNKENQSNFKKCDRILLCGHTCLSNCDDYFVIHKTCRKECKKLLICGHRCIETCAKDGNLCHEKRKFNCGHIVKERECTKPFPICKEPCLRQCVHQKCDSRCSDPCSVTACNRNCSNLLKCGHHCLGYCGEPCPNICSICNNAYDNKFRYVLLTDCGHCCNSDDINKLFNNMKHIAIPVCPVCSTPIINTKRFKFKIWQLLNNISLINSRIQLDKFNKDNCKIINSLKKTLLSINENSLLVKHCPNYIKTKKSLKETLAQCKKSEIYLFSQKRCHIFIIEILLKFDNLIELLKNRVLERNIDWERLNNFFEELNNRKSFISLDEIYLFTIEYVKWIFRVEYYIISEKCKSDKKISSNIVDEIKLLLSDFDNVSHQAFSAIVKKLRNLFEKLENTELMLNDKQFFIEKIYSKNLLDSMKSTVHNGFWYTNAENEIIFSFSSFSM